MHVVEIYPTEVKCICTFQKNQSPGNSVKEIAYKHATQHPGSQIRDMRKKPYSTVEVGEGKGKPIQGELFIRPD